MRPCPVPLSRAIRVCAVVCGLTGQAAAFGAPARSHVPARTQERAIDNWEQTTARLETTRATGGVSDADDWLG
jgi:hypothetical protein